MPHEATVLELRSFGAFGDVQLQARWTGVKYRGFPGWYKINGRSTKGFDAGRAGRAGPLVPSPLPVPNPGSLRLEPESISRADSEAQLPDPTDLFHLLHRKQPRHHATHAVCGIDSSTPGSARVYGARCMSVWRSLTTKKRVRTVSAPVRSCCSVRVAHRRHLQGARKPRAPHLDLAHFWARQ